MTSLEWVNAYVCANILIVVVTLLIGGLRAVSHRLTAPLPYRHLRHVAYVLAVAALLLPIWSALSAGRSAIPQIAQAWAAPSMHSQQLLPAGDYHLSTAMMPGGTPLSLDFPGRLLWGPFLISVAAWLAWLGVDTGRALRVLRTADVVRRVGRVWLLVASSTAVPFAFWTPRRSVIVLPMAFLNRPSDLRMALRHEAQHHRQGDAVSVYILQALRGIFLCNPAAHLLVRQLLELQELACDEAVLRRSTVSASDYCHCLVRVVESAMRGRLLLQRGMAGGHRNSLLVRIGAAMGRPPRYLHTSITLTTSVLLVAAVLTVSVAFGSVIKDQRISLGDAEAMAVAAQKATPFPVVMNAAVAEQLNLLLGTRDGRLYLRFARARMRQYRTSLTRDMTDHSLPVALLALPLIESGYRNIPAGSDPGRGAGLWMFIARTATRYGLRIAPDADERLDVALETNAAARLLTALHARFGDWQLALLAYNAGELKVATGIRNTGTRDPWILADRGYGNDPNYLARAMAGIIILGNPAELQAL